MAPRKRTQRVVEIDEDFQIEFSGRYVKLEWLLEDTPIEVWTLRVHLGTSNKFAVSGDTSYYHQVGQQRGRGLTKANFKTVASLHRAQVDLYGWQLRADDTQLRRIGMAEFMRAQEMATRMGELLRKEWNTVSVT